MRIIYCLAGGQWSEEIRNNNWNNWEIHLTRIFFILFKSISKKTKSLEIPFIPYEKKWTIDEKLETNHLTSILKIYKQMPKPIMRETTKPNYKFALTPL